MLEAGVKAPEFSLQDKDGNIVSLKDFLGKKVVVYFYPKVIGISKDSVKSHANFAAKQELPFILLADPERQAIEAYDVWQEKKLYGKVSMGVVRTTYIVDEKGMIEKAYPNANPDTNAEEILAYLKG